MRRAENRTMPNINHELQPGVSETPCCDGVSRRSDRGAGVTVLLSRIASGDGMAAHDLLPLVYDQLRAVAGRAFRGQPSHHTLQPTVLVHEACMRLLLAEEASAGGAGE